MANLLKDPALVVGIVRSVLILLVSFGIGLTDPQVQAILNLTGLLLAGISLALTGVTRATTTPTANPSLEQGTLVTVVTPSNEPNKHVIV